MTVEQELIKVSRFKGEDEGNRQEYLTRLRVHADKISDEKWRSLSEEAKDWLDAAADAKDNERELPDFEDAEPEDTEPEEGPDPEEPEEDDDAEPETEDGEGGNEDETSDTSGTDEDGEVADEPEPPAEPAKPQARRDRGEAKRPRRPKKTPAEKPKPAARDYTGISGAKDRFGVVIGTKAHDAVKMFEKGSTMTQVMDALQSGRFYNLLKRLVEEGHKVEKLEGGVWKLTHKTEKKKGK